MKNFVRLLVLFAGLVPAIAQTTVPTPPPAQAPVTVTPTSTFSLNASVMQIGNVVSGSTAAADFGGTLQLTNTVALRQENILAPSASWQGYFGGFNWAPGFFAKQIAKTKLSPNQFQPYFTASIGAGINSQENKTKQNVGEMLGGGVAYSPTSNGKFTVNLFELRYGHLPGFNSSAVILSGGLKLGW
jgi:hypothetical protein